MPHHNEGNLFIPRQCNRLDEASIFPAACSGSVTVQARELYVSPWYEAFGEQLTGPAADLERVIHLEAECVSDEVLPLGSRIQACDLAGNCLIFEPENVVTGAFVYLPIVVR